MVIFTQNIEIMNSKLLLDNLNMFNLYIVPAQELNS